MIVALPALTGKDKDAATRKIAMRSSSSATMNGLADERSRIIDGDVIDARGKVFCSSANLIPVLVHLDESRGVAETQKGAES